MLAQHVSEQYPHLFSPLKIGTLTTANRLFVSAMVTNFCDMDGFATERYIAYHEEKAKGGWGLIITEDYAVTPDGRGFKTPGLWKDEQIAGHRELTRRVHQYQSRIFAQIYHCGRQTHPLMPYTRKPATASALNCPACLMDTRELTIPEIQEIVTQFADCASRAKAAGFDGVEIHGAHGYLIAQFMSWHANKRVDEYGGPLGNRMRFPLEIISAIKQTCGADFPVTFRISGEELVRDGRTIEDTVYIATLLEKAGIDGLHVSMGTYGAPDSIIPPAGSEPGRAIRYAEAVKQAVSIPVFAVNRISEPGMAENILRMGRADAVVMGRGSLADPHLPAKVMEGRLEDVRRCIGCMQGCVGNLHKLDGIACLVNPELGYEEKQECRPAREKKKVVVIGGGIAGMQAAVTARTRGHEVSLYEASSKLGGQFALACVPPEKGNLASETAWLTGQLKRTGVEVHLNTRVTRELVLEQKPDAVVIATGSRAVVPPIPGIDGPKVVLAAQVLSGEVRCGQKVLIAGGGSVGAETADFLGDYGHQVTVLDMLPTIAADEGARRYKLMLALERQKARLLPGSRLVSINGGDVSYEREGRTITESFDTIVLALGVRADNSLADEIKGLVPAVFTVGDAVKGRNAVSAIREGFWAATEI